jgi:two-component system chemotaxis sensor kinase CheA
MTEFDREAIVQTFLVESEEQMGQMEEALVALEALPEDDDALQTIFRVAHTLKGNASCLGLAAVADFAHALEDLLDRLRSRTLVASPQVVTLLLRAVDVLRVMVPRELSGSQGMSEEHQTLLAALKAGLAPEGGNAVAAQGPRPTNVAPPVRTLRVDLSRLDRLLDLSGEIAIARGRLGQMLESGDSERLLEAHKDMDPLYLDLQEEIFKARMVPVGPTFRQQIRTVRDIALAHGKQARLRIDGEDVEVDTTVIECIRAPLTHLIRNAIDHGIETPGIRQALGKAAHGELLLRAYHTTGYIVIEFTDDGAGLDRPRILARARERGLVAEGQRLADGEIDRLIFEPGFSTAEEVTDLSGRGIGMDVVRRNIEALRGTIAVRSEAGKGTTVTLRLPLTLAIIQGFLVEVAGETYVIPLEAVLECLDLQEATPDASTGVIGLRGAVVPYLRLKQALGLEGAPSSRESVVVIGHQQCRVGLVVDSLLGEGQAVIKPLGPPFDVLPGVAGSTILGSGRVALILDVPALVETAISRSKGSPTGPQPMAPRLLDEQ